MFGTLVCLLALAFAACTGPNPAYRGAGGAVESPDAAGSPSGDAPADMGSLDARPDRPGPDSATDRANEAESDAGGFAVTPRLVGYWKLDEAPGALTALDSSGNGNHGTLEGLDPQTAWVAGRLGNAIQFTPAEGGEAGVQVPLSSSLSGVNTFTLAAWIYRTGLLATQNTCVISRQLGSEHWEIYNLSTINDELVIYAVTDPSAAPRVRIAGAAPVDQWMHVAATYDGANLRLYKNGVEIGFSPLSRQLPSDQTPLYIGTNKNPLRNDVFLGLIDEVVLYGVALSAADVARLHGGTSPEEL
jgi:large repetitive protein